MEIHTFNKDQEKVRVGVETVAKYVRCGTRELVLPCIFLLGSKPKAKHSNRLNC